MKLLVRAAFAVSTTIPVGAMVFFIAIVAPATFVALPIDTEGRMLAKLFPSYYTLIAWLCVASFAATRPPNDVNSLRSVWGARIGTAYC